MESLGTFATDTTGQLDVLGHDGHPLGVDGAQVGVLEQTYQVSLAGLLQSHDGRALEAQVGLEVLGDLTDQPLEGELADEQLCALLVPPDFSQSHGSRSVTVGFLHSAGGRSALASGFGSQLLPGGLASGGFTGSLLRTSHLVFTAFQEKTEMKFGAGEPSFIVVSLSKLRAIAAAAAGS